MAYSSKAQKQSLAPYFTGLAMSGALWTTLILMVFASQ